MAVYIILSLAVVTINTCFAVEVPSVTLMNAAVPGTKMPVTGIGTGAYVYEPRTEPGENMDRRCCRELRRTMVGLRWEAHRRFSQLSQSTWSGQSDKS